MQYRKISWEKEVFCLFYCCVLSIVNKFENNALTMLQNMKTPLVSIILPVYNGEQYIKEAVESMLGQTYANFELLLLDDGSTDKTIEILRSYTDHRIRLIKNEQNLGIVATLNKGIMLSNGLYIARMDADDISHRERLLKQVEFLQQNPNVGMIDSVMEYIDENSKPVGRMNSDIIDEGAIRNFLTKSNCMGHSSVMMPASVIKKYLYRKIFYEDYDLWLRLLNDGLRICKLPAPLLYYRLHNQSITGIAYSNRQHFLKLATTKWFYYKHLSFAEMLKLFNIKVLYNTILNFITGYYKLAVHKSKK